MDRENYIMGQNYTLVVTSPLLCCADRKSNCCTYIFFNDVKLVLQKSAVFERACNVSNRVIQLIEMSCGLSQFQLLGSLKKPSF